MLRLVVIGIGTGNPEHMTVQAIKALNRADLVLIPRKGESKSDLADLRREICARYLENRATRVVEFDLPTRDAGADYRAGVDAWHRQIAGAYREILAEQAGANSTAALLVWGDPSLYDSTLRILDHLKGSGGLDVEISVVPGITSLQALAACHRIALNTIGGPVHVTTGRRLRQDGAPDADSVVVMLDGDCAFRSLRDGPYTIFWGAYLGMENEVAISGPLDEVADRIEAVRAEAREANGWIMDTYLLRRG